MPDTGGDPTPKCSQGHPQSKFGAGNKRILAAVLVLDPQSWQNHVRVGLFLKGFRPLFYLVTFGGPDSREGVTLRRRGCRA